MKGRYLSSRAAKLLLAAAAAGLLAGGCAKYPSGTGADTFTKVSFRMKVRGQINPNYVYIVAIRVITTEDTPNTGAPIPVIGSNTPNGFVAGSPTHFVRFDPNSNPNQPFILYKFNPGPTQNDPTNTVNLASWYDTTATRGPIVNYSSLSDYPSELRFDLFTNQLVDADSEAGTITKLQVNFLTMNKTAVSGTSGREWDALGNSQSSSDITDTITIDLRSNNQVDNGPDPDSNPTLEPAGDTVGGDDASLDLTDFTVSVTQP